MLVKIRREKASHLPIVSCSVMCTKSIDADRAHATKLGKDFSMSLGKPIHIDYKSLLRFLQGKAGLLVQEGSDICRRHLGLLPGIATFPPLALLLL